MKPNVFKTQKNKFQMKEFHLSSYCQKFIWEELLAHRWSLKTLPNLKIQEPNFMLPEQSSPPTHLSDQATLIGLFKDI